MHSRTNKPSSRVKRSLQENQAKSRVGCAYGNRVSSCFALRRSLRRSWYMSRFCVGHIIANAFKDLPKFIAVIQVRFYILRSWLFPREISLAGWRFDRFVPLISLFLRLLLLSAMFTRVGIAYISFYSSDVKTLFEIQCFTLLVDF